MSFWVPLQAHVFLACIGVLGNGLRHKVSTLLETLRDDFWGLPSLEPRSGRYPEMSFGLKDLLVQRDEHMYINIDGKT